MNVLRGHSAEGAFCAGVENLPKALRTLARPTRFELVTSAFGGQFPKFAMSCSGLLTWGKVPSLRRNPIEHFYCRLIGFAASW
jgi:hypothetical protein